MIIFQILVGDPRFVVGRLIDFLICVGTGLFCVQVVARIQSHLAPKNFRNSFRLSFWDMSSKCFVQYPGFN